MPRVLEGATIIQVAMPPYRRHFLEELVDGFAQFHAVMSYMTEQQVSPDLMWSLERDLVSRACSHGSQSPQPDDVGRLASPSLFAAEVRALGACQLPFDSTLQRPSNPAATSVEAF